MKKIRYFIMCVAATGLLFSCSGKKEIKEANYEVVPLPSEITTENGASFTLSKATKIVFPKENEKMQRNARFLAEYLEIATGIKFETTDTPPQKNAIILALGMENENPEAYRIEVAENTITITGSSEAGVFYGIQTLRKATPVGKNISIIPH
jgi:hexosaminidase